MAKGGRPDKSDIIAGMFSKIAREADRNKKRALREAKKTGAFIELDHPELQSIEDQIKYYAAKRKHEKGDNQYDIFYDRDGADFPWPYKFAKEDDDK